MIINITALSDKGREKLGFQKIAFNVNTDNVQDFEALHDEDNEVLNECEFEKYQSLRINDFKFDKNS